MKKNFMKTKKFKYGALSTSIIIGFIAIVVLLNVILNLLVVKFPLKFDLTNNQDYEFTQESIDFVKKIERPVTITILAEDTTIITASINKYIAQMYAQYGISTTASVSDTYFEELLNDYIRYSDKISVKYVDINKNPNFLENNKIKSIDVSATDSVIIVQCNENQKYKIIGLYDLIKLSSGGGNGSQLPSFTNIAEGSITSAIQYSITDNENIAYLLEGHGEVYSDVLKNRLVKLGYDTQAINLKTADFNDKSKIIICNNPTLDFTIDEIEKLEKFIANGGQFGNSFMFLENATTPNLPLIENFLSKKWGLTISQKRIVDLEYANYNLMQLDYSDTSLASKLIEKKMKLYAQIYSPKQLILDPEVIPNVKSMYKTKDTAYLKDLSDKNNNKEEKDQTGVFDVGAMSYTNKSVYEPTEVLNKSYVFVGTTTSIGDALENEGNGLYFDSVINTMTGIAGKEYVYIPAKEISQSALEIPNDYTLIVTSVIFVIILPLIIIGFGVFVWLRRRHL
ncbi:MAG: Gldg family protein [Clostridia bacterium]